MPHSILPRLGASSLLGISLCLAASANADGLDALKHYNLILSGDLWTSSEVEGRTIIGGDLTSTGSSNYAFKLTSVPSTDLTLRIGGNLFAPNSTDPGSAIQVVYGSLELGGATGGRQINFNNGGSLIANPNAQSEYQSIFNDLTETSQSLATLGANSSVTIPGDQPGHFVFNATADENGLAVFGIDAGDLFGNWNVQEIQLNPDEFTKNIVINVSGGNQIDENGVLIDPINFNNGHMTGLLKDEMYWRANIIWNFFEATEISIDRQFFGQILAPNANVTNTTPIEGSMFAKSLTAHGEMHLPGYDGTIQIPEPSSTLLGLFGAVALLRRRRH